MRFGWSIGRSAIPFRVQAWSMFWSRGVLITPDFLTPNRDFIASCNLLFHLPSHTCTQWSFMKYSQQPRVVLHEKQPNKTITTKTGTRFFKEEGNPGQRER